jgi:glycosyltransferase 2 family protein
MGRLKPTKDHRCALNIRKWALPIIGVLVSGFFLWISFRNLSPQEVLADIQQVNILLLLLGAALYFPASFLITVRWWFLVRPIKNVPVRRLYPLVAIGYAGNNIYPFRGGEVLRAFVLYRDEKIAFGRSATSILVERAFDGIVMLTFIVIGLLFSNVQSVEVQKVAVLTAPIFFMALVVFFALALQPHLLRALVNFVTRLLPSPLRKAVVGVSEDVIVGFEGLRSPANVLGAIVFSYLSWMVEASVYWVVAQACGLNLPYHNLLLVVGVVNLAGLIPASPGQIGVYEFFVSTVLIALGVANVEAKAYALVVHMVIWLPITVVGLFYLARQGLNMASIANAGRIKNEVA